MWPKSLSLLDLSRAPSEDGVPAPEEAMEATEEDQESPGQDSSQPGIYTEHVFTDPLGTESSGASTGNDNQRWAGHSVFITVDLYPDLDKDSSFLGFLVRESDQDRDDMASADGKTNLAKEETQRMSSALPTMWLGAQNGWWDTHTQIHVSFMATDFVKHHNLWTETVLSGIVVYFVLYAILCMDLSFATCVFWSIFGHLKFVVSQIGLFDFFPWCRKCWRNSVIHS